MKYKTLIPNSHLHSDIDAIVNNMVSDMENMLIEVGERCMDNIEANRGYQNQTGNLSDSRGFAVANNGHVVYMSDFKSTEGGIKGRVLAEKRAALTYGIAIVLVAGEEYAEYMETQGHNVISSGEIHALKLVPRLLKSLTDAKNRAGNRV